MTKSCPHYNRVSKLKFPVAKFKLLVAKSKFGLTEVKLPPIFYCYYWYIVLAIGSIPFLKVSILNSFIYAKEIATLLF